MATIVEPREDDVLLGRGKGATDREGNQRYFNLLKENWSKYLQCETNKEKHRLFMGIIAKIHACGGRFLKSLDNGNLYEEIPNKQARVKVGQAMRHYGRIQSSKSQKAAKTMGLNESCTLHPGATEVAATSDRRKARPRKSPTNSVLMVVMQDKAPVEEAKNSTPEVPQVQTLLDAFLQSQQVEATLQDSCIENSSFQSLVLEDFDDLSTVTMQDSAPAELAQKDELQNSCAAHQEDECATEDHRITIESHPPRGRNDCASSSQHHSIFGEEDHHKKLMPTMHSYAFEPTPIREEKHHDLTQFNTGALVDTTMCSAGQEARDWNGVFSPEVHKDGRSSHKIKKHCQHYPARALPPPPSLCSYYPTQQPRMATKPVSTSAVLPHSSPFVTPELMASLVSASNAAFYKNMASVMQRRSVSSAAGAVVPQQNMTPYWNVTHTTPGQQQDPYCSPQSYTHDLTRKGCVPTQPAQIIAPPPPPPRQQEAYSGGLPTSHSSVVSWPDH